MSLSGSFQNMCEFGWLLAGFADPASARNAMASMDGFPGFDPNRPLVVRPAGTGMYKGS